MYSIPVSVKAGLTPCAGYRFLLLLSSHLQTILATMPAITEEIKEKTSLIAITSFPCLCWRWQHIYYRVLKGLKNLTKTNKNQQNKSRGNASAFPSKNLETNALRFITEIIPHRHNNLIYGISIIHDTKDTFNALLHFLLGNAIVRIGV